MCQVGVGSGLEDVDEEDPEISQISLSTNFLRGRTSGQDPRNPKKVVRTPGFPKKVVRTPRSRESGVWTPGNREFPRRWTRSWENGRFPGFPGGRKKVKAAP